jgi:hypothetical protein
LGEGRCKLRKIAKREDFHTDGDSQWWRNFAEDVYRDFERDGGADPTRLRDLRASLDLLREYQALGELVGNKIIKGGVNAMEAEAAKQDARDEALRVEASKEEGAKKAV